jgi:NAD-dependent deacetylase
MHQLVERNKHKQMKQIVVITGAGISAESGLKTFRDSGGLWEGHNVYDVATPEAWSRNPDMVQSFYNERRKSVIKAEPNAAHFALVKLEEKYEVTIITQNIDDLHERAGSSRIIHLHGLITKSQSDRNPNLIYDISGWELKMGELCELGSQLRPHVVWFGEAVPMIEKAAKQCYIADIVLVIGTSLKVYPAAGLIDLVPAKAKKILVDPRAMEISAKNIEMIPENAATAVPELVERLLNQ